MDSDTSYRPSWIQSKEFKFIVGPERREFMVHSELVAKQSEPLRALITNGMKESLEGIAVCPDVDSGTFERFAEFLYTRDFYAPGFAPLRTDPEQREDRDINESDIDDDPVIKSAWVRFSGRRRYISHQMPTVYEAFAFIDDFGDVGDGCIAIAKVHILAHYYDIDHLMDFFRGKMHSLLSLYPRREEACSLLRFCMAEPGAEGLREMVYEYVALGLRWLLLEDEFQPVIDEFPQAATEIMKKLKSFQNFYCRKSRGLHYARSPSPEDVIGRNWA